jgi:hypothetical protein
MWEHIIRPDTYLPEFLLKHTDTEVQINDPQCDDLQVRKQSVKAEVPVNGGSVEQAPLGLIYKTSSLVT